MSLTVRDLIATARTRIREIRPSELLDLQRFGCPVVDVREPDEFADGHIPGAVNIPLPQLRSRLSELPKDREIHVICRSAQRAYYATRILLQNGFKAKNISGGMLSRAMLAIAETK